MPTIKVFRFIPELDAFVFESAFRHISDHLGQLGYSADELMILDPDRFQNGQDGPCHSPEVRRRFWTDVLSSLTLSLELPFDEARPVNEHNRKSWPDEHIADLEERIREISTGRFGQTAD